MTDPLELCLAGHLSPQVALARAVLAGAAPARLASRLAGREGPRATELRRLLTEGGVERLRRTAAAFGLNHAAGAETPESLRAAYDRAVALSPEAAVAAYSLGDPATLAAATDEILRFLIEARLLGVTLDVLDLGCGTGRVARAVAPYVRSVIGIDISAGMIAAARRRPARGVRFRQTDGRGIPLPAGSLDLVLAVDSFPYLVMTKLAEQHVAEAARVLRPGGALAILNLSYRGLEIDRADAVSWCAAQGFTLMIDGVTPFTLWDGAVFLMRRAGG